VGTIKADLAELTSLGKSGAVFDGLQVFPSHSAPGQISVALHCAEFTCLCPLTGQPDWADIDILYKPDRLIVETKSVKLYLEQFRSVGMFHEHLAQHICDDFVPVLDPIKLSVIVRFKIRGGISVDAIAEYRRSPKEE